MTENTPDAVKVALHHAIELEQCALFVEADAGKHLAKAMTDAAAFLRGAGARAMQAAMPAPAGVTRPSDKKLREAYALSDLICPETTTVEAEMLGIWNVLNGETRGQGARAWEGATVTYSSTQATKCCQCGQMKHTPLRVDRLGGYICLTCIDRELHKPTHAGAVDLVERLRGTSPRYCERTGEHKYDVFANRDGDEAASRIEALEAEVAREKLRADAEAAEVNLLTHQRDAFRRDRNLAEHRATTAEAERDALRAEVERKDGALRNLAEGNLGDGPGQANYDRVRSVARAALAPAKGG